MAIAAGYAHSMALSNNATIVDWGDSGYGQTNAPSPDLKNVKLIAAGAYQTLISPFSPLVQYQIDVTKDLLLIYNVGTTNNSARTNSAYVKDYYVAHRPLVGTANVIAIDCVTNERVDLPTFTTQIVTPVLQWLTNNPTEHPQYLILFPDIPSRVWYTNGSGEFTSASSSVAYGLSTRIPGIQPFVTSINMGFFDATNDCIHYIDKLVALGTNGTLIISASVGGYPNTNYLLDDIRHGTGYVCPPLDCDYSPNGDKIYSATSALLAAGVRASVLTFSTPGG